VVRFAPRPRRWGNIIWKKDLLLIEPRLQKRRLFPRAPEWNPASKLELPALRVVANYIAPPAARQNPPLPWGSILWTKDLVLFELRVQKRRVFPLARPDTKAKALEFPALRLARKSPESERLKPSHEMEMSR
jgi:hypothetical protein